MVKVIKRDGREVAFDSSRIINAITKAMNRTGDVDLGIPTRIVNVISKKIDKLQTLTVEEIQDLVELELMKSKRKDVALEYIRYRHMRNEERVKIQNLDNKVAELINLSENVANENANKDSKLFNTQRDLLAGIVSKDYAMRHMLPKDVAEAHSKGDIHIHDLDYNPFQPTFNCMLIDFKGMFENGFTIGNAEVERPKSITTATALIAQIVANVSSNIYGGTTFDRADETLEPYAIMSWNKHLNKAKKWIDNKDKQEQYAYEMTEKEIYDAFQGLEYEINTLFNSNGQTPFFSLNFGLGTSWFAKKIQESILKVRIDGLGKSRKTAVFPKLIFTIKRGLNLEQSDPNYDIKKLASECATKRMYPDILSYDKVVEITGDFKSSMSCRSFLSSYKEDGEFVTSGRNNLGVITLNLPRIAIESKGNKELFWSLLDERLEVCKKALDFRIQSLERATPKNAPILYKYGATGKRLSDNDKPSEIFKNGRSTISLGYIGIHELATVFHGNDWQDNNEAKEFTLDVLKYMKKHTDKWKQETGYAFGVYGTPSESLTDRFARIDREVFGDIEHITDKGYYTNSFHYDVRKKVTPFEKIEFEKDYPYISSGGFIHYCEFPSLINNPEGLEAVWDFAYDRIAYFGTNTPVDTCYECDYKGEFEATSNGFKCPNCNNTNPDTSSVVRRLCGYLGSVIQRKPIKGRLKEIQSRTKHM